MTQQNNEPAHSKYSPSGSKVWLNCPRYLQEAAKVPKKPGNEASMMGTAAHELAELCLTLNNNTDVYKYKVFKIERDDTPGVFEVPFNAINVEGVQGYVDLCRELSNGADEVNIEERLDGSFIDPDLGGTADFSSVFVLDKLIVGDYKNGRILVPAYQNTQMMIYAAIKLGDNPYMVNTVNMFIYQPNSSRDEALSSWSISVEDLTEWRDTVLIPAIKASKSPDAVFKTGDWCKEGWCQFYTNGTCPALLEGMFGPKVDGDHISDKSLVEVRKRAEVDVTRLTDDELDRFLEMWPIYKAFGAAIEAEAFNRLLSGAADAPKSHKIVEGAGRRYWRYDEAETVAALSKVLPRKLLYDEKIKTVAGVERKLKALGATLNSDLVEVRRGKTMVPVSDRREAITNNSADEMFGD